jgi:uroporphyrinogen III methyltransferase/synthase
VLLARADRGRELLRQELERVARVEQIAVYAQVDAVEADSTVQQALRHGEIDFVTVTSSNIARALWGLLDETARSLLQRGQMRVVSISPVTSATLQELGVPVAAEATEYTADGVVQALVKLCRTGQI